MVFTDLGLANVGEKSALGFFLFNGAILSDFLLHLYKADFTVRKPNMQPPHYLVVD